MAKNYTLGEAVKVIADGTDIEAITDIGRRYPVLTAKIATIAGGSSKKEFVEFAQSFPDYLTANKMNKCLKEGIDETEVDDEDDEDEASAAKPAKKAPAKKVGRKKAVADDEDDEDGIDASGTDYASMNNSQLYKILGEKGERKACKEEFGKLDKKSMVAYLEKHYGDGADDADDDDDDGDESEYADMSAVELFKECKKRGLKAKPKQKQKFYIDLLEKDDAAKAEVDDDEDDDEWDDEEPEEKPAKKAAPAKKAGRGRPKKQAEPEPEEDDDDDWEI